LRRAGTARDFRVGNGVAATRLSIISDGKDHPIEPGSNADPWEKNLKATTTVQYLRG
jgi:peptidoglycan-associated lipoprotein